MGSLIGAISSQKVTEEPKGTLSPVGNRAASAMVEGCLTASLIRRAGAKAGHSDPAVLDGKAVAQQIKGGRRPGGGPRGRGGARNPHYQHRGRGGGGGGMGGSRESK